MFQNPKKNSLILPGGGAVPAPDEKEIRIRYSAMREYVEVSERDNKQVGVAEGLSIALMLANVFLTRLGEMDRLTLCSKCLKPLSATEADEDGNGVNG